MNITPFVLNGWPMNEVDQKMMAKLREAADQKGITVIEVMDEAIEQYVSAKLKKLKRETENKNLADKILTYHAIR